MSNKPRLLTGDTPTGRLHLGHWVGSVENRVKLQDDYDCFFIIANIHAFTTRADKPNAIRESTLDVAYDMLGAGIDPDKSTIFIQSEVRAISELTYFFSMLTPFSRLMRNPTIKDEIRDKGLGDNYSFGFLLYPIGQIADILAFRPELVPVGEDQVPHLELTREVARRFNQLYCGVDSHLEDEQHVENGGLFHIIKPMLSKTTRLVGTGGPNADGKLLKMSKSLNNSIMLSDDNDTIRKKVMGMYTDPNRLRPTDKGTIENNPLWIFHDAFTKDSDWVEQAKERYRNGEIGDVECKRKLVDSLVDLIEPIRTRREQYANDPQQVIDILKRHNEKANAVADETWALAKAAMQQDFFA